MESNKKNLWYEVWFPGGTSWGLRIKLIPRFGFVNGWLLRKVKVNF
jgi:hypothetical protein